MDAAAAGPYDHVALALQGGGALGAYHVGAYEALAAAGYEPDSVAGISIGAINAALIAGNEPARRVQRMKEFWREITWPTVGDRAPMAPSMRRLYNYAHTLQAEVMGQPHFFRIRSPSPYLAWPGTAGATSFCDTSELRTTLLEFVDFDRINRRRVRLVLGAAKVTTGEAVFFDSEKQPIGPEHVMASGALPPFFPGIRIDGDLYWDGSCVSNTPLDGLLDPTPPGRSLVFMLDLFDPDGPEPTTVDEVERRRLDIEYASRTAEHLKRIVQRLNLHQALRSTLASPRDAADVAPGLRDLIAGAGGPGPGGPGPERPGPEGPGPGGPGPGGPGPDAEVDIVQVVASTPKTDLSTREADFSRLSIAQRMAAGNRDLTFVVDHPPWLSQPAGALAAQVHRVRPPG